MALRIGFDVTPLSVPRSGVGTYTACLLDQLKKGPNRILPLSQYSTDYRWSANPMAAGGETDRPSSLNKTLWMQMILPWQLRRLQPDVCHFTNSVAPIWSPCPIVLTIHDMTLWQFPEFHPLRRQVSMRPVVPFAARQAAAIIAVSHSTKDDIVKILKVPPEKVTVIYEAPDKGFKPLATVPELEYARRTYDLPERYILHVGTLEPRKNLVRLLEAFAKLRQRKAINHDLVLVGKKGWSYDEIFAAVDRLELAKAVHFLDYVPGPLLPAVYNMADALVLVSLYEGFGLPVVEAMACGTPVIASPNGALSEVGGEAVFYVDPQDTESMADGLQRVLVDRQLHERLRVGGLARSANFNWARTAELTGSLYRQVISGIKEPATMPGPTLVEKQTGVR